MTNSRPLTIAVGMSGGVDSTMAACLLKRQGFDVVGVTMQIWDGSVDIPAEERRSGCYGPGEKQDLEELRTLTARLGIRHVTIPLAAEYRQWVLDYFRSEYLAGRTPNPCVMCNWKLKFGLLLDKARAAGLAFDRFATGHYARVEGGVAQPCDTAPAGGVAHTGNAANARYMLKRGLDADKDQSYFLYHLTQAQLRNLIFPLGALKKTEVKALACELGLAQLAARSESQDFIECKHYGALFKDETVRPGPIVDRAGRVLGEHKGIIYYTIGQRKGLGLSGTKDPLYVVHIDGPGNTITVGSYADLFSGRLRATDVNWIAFDALRAPMQVQAKIRQQHKEAAATVTPDDTGGHTITVVFDQPQMAIAPGQAVVFYQDDLVLGGGTIV